MLAELESAGDLGRFLSARMFAATPSIFGGDHQSWVHWRCELAERLGVDDHGVLLAGSAAFGISLNPDKAFRPFDVRSDIDVAVIDQRHFETAWYELRHMRERLWTQMPRPVKRELKRFAPNYVFSGAIATDKVLSRLSFGRDWLLALNHMAGVPPTEDREIKVRLYRDAAALRDYQLRGLRDAQAALMQEEQ